ncbi:ArsR/SmtB family transcription factor [Nonomuraea sp. NPDC050556]|uniref:ArsR/SmtB family transcription factor n=1 Tax=Nonomuraea sp. NPDC050556 TaxID=3364369 RepID=UPI0037BCB8E0
MRTDHVFTALANPVRRELLRLLLDEGDQPAGRLAEHFSLSRPSVSEHLRLLRHAGLVVERRQGRERLYTLDPQPLKDLRDWLTPYL